MKRPAKSPGTIACGAFFFVYILQCVDGTFYTGYTKDLEARLNLHNSGKGSKYVRSRRPAKIVYSRAYRCYKAAMREEARIKSLSRKEKGDLIILPRKRGAL